MFDDTLPVALVSVLLVASALGPGAVAAASGGSHAYAGSNVTFDTATNAITDYAVGGSTTMASVRVQSKSALQASGSVGLDAGLAAVTNVDGSAVSLGATTKTSASVMTDSGATMTAHDDPNGILVVRAGGKDQYVGIGVPSSASAKNDGQGRVVVTTDDGTQSTILVVGDGNVTVNDAGNVTAKLGNDARLVVRSYSGGRTAADRHEESLIENGTATAQVSVMQRGGQAVSDVATFGSDTTVQVNDAARGHVKMAVARTKHTGKVVITSVSKEVIQSTDNLSVTVDGSAAAKASSYSDLEGAIGSDNSKFMVRQASSASASAKVLVAIDHFSKHSVELSSKGDTSAGTGGSSASTTTSTDGSGGGSTSTTTPTSSQAPGLGVGAALFALVGAAFVALRRR